MLYTSLASHNGTARRTSPQIKAIIIQIGSKPNYTFHIIVWQKVSVCFAPLHMTILNNALFVSLFSLLPKPNKNFKPPYHFDILATSSNGMHASLDTMLKFAQKKYISRLQHMTGGPGSVVGIATGLKFGRYGDRIPVGARFSAPVQTGPGAHPASCTMGTRSFPGVKSGRGVTLTLHPLLVPLIMKE